MPCTRLERASVASLPVELLLLILKSIYVDTREALATTSPHECATECMYMPVGPYLTKWNDDDDLKSPSVFPYALSAVCKAWFNVMLLVPAFWTRLVIFVDEERTSISTLRSQLSASRNLPFRAHIFNRQIAICQDTAEGPRVKAVVDELIPHLHRCERLTFDVMHNSSLPSICHTFSGSYSLLTELSMQCRIYDEPQGFDNGGEERMEPFFFPGLNSIALTGSAFVDFIKTPPWRGGGNMYLFSLSHLSSLKNLNLTFTGLIHILNKFDRISSLELKHIDLPYDPSEQVPSGWDLRVQICSILLEGFKRAPFKAFNELVNGLDLESQTIRACELSAGHVNETMNFTLEDIHSTEDLLSIIPTLSNRSVNFISCQGLNDACLELLSKPNPRTHLWSLEILKDLTISRCPGISVRALKDLVESRLVEASARGYGVNPEYDDYDELMPLDSLKVFDCGLNISSEDAQWFEGKVGCFLGYGGV